MDSKGLIGPKFLREFLKPIPWVKQVVVRHPKSTGDIPADDAYALFEAYKVRDL